MALTGTKTYQNYIGGEWVDASGEETFESTNPATGDVIGAFPKSTVSDVDRAVDAAKEAYERWRLVPAPKRAEILFRVGQRFIDRKDELTELMVQEMGKVRPEAGGDVQEAIDMTYYMAGERFVEIFEEAGLPPGVLNIEHGGGGTVGERLVKHPDVPLISLTGSREVGIKTAQNGAAYLKHVHLELGGKNAIIVMDDADLDLAVDGIVWSAFGTSGQRCTAASRVIVHRK